MLGWESKKPEGFPEYSLANNQKSIIYPIPRLGSQEDFCSHSAFVIVNNTKTVLADTNTLPEIKTYLKNS